MIMRSVHQQQTKILNIYVLINRARKYMKQKTDRTVRNKSRIIVIDFNIPLLIIDRTRRQNISKNIDDLNTINQLYLINIIDHSLNSNRIYILFKYI